MDATLAKRLSELTELAAAVIDTPIAAVTVVTGRDVRVLAGVGVPAGHVTETEQSACPDVTRTGAPLILGDIRRDRRYACSPLRESDLRFYAGWPLAAPGHEPVGVLCVADRRPRRLTAGHKRALSLLARHATAELTGERGELIADRLRDDFIALVSHEVRTPLAAIQGYVELLLDDLPSTDNRQERLAASIEANVGRLVRLIDQLLLTATANGGGLALRREPVDLVALAGTAIDRVRPLADAAGVKLAQQTVGSVREVDADRSLLTQALDNLLRNGVRFTPSGGAVDLLVGGTPATIEVIDSGVGIPAHEQARVFDRFFRGEYAQQHAIPGAGLGLSLVKAVAEAHGGAVWLSSDPSGRAGTHLSMRVQGGAPC